jgi:AcrR family transcriptional regulator
MRQRDTRERLIDAAGEVFSGRGFAAATVREICAKAKANVSAVKYHFGGKKQLYEALIRHAFEEGLAAYPPDMGLSGQASPEERLVAFVRSFLHRLSGQGRGAWYGRLLAREMAEPTEVLSGVVPALIAPLSQRLQAIVRDLLGTEAPPEAVRLCAVSVAGQCQHFCRARSLLARLYPDLPLDHAGVEKLARHVAAFSLAALKHYRHSSAA